MNCPRCNLPTEVRRIGSVDVNRCSRCRGVFLDRGELNRVAEPTGGDLEYSTVHGETFRHADAWTAIDCPHCGGAEMRNVEFNVHTGIILDYCDQCHGFWLDGRELDRINDAVRDLEQPDGGVRSPIMEWFAQFLFSLPR